MDQVPVSTGRPILDDVVLYGTSAGSAARARVSGLISVSGWAIVPWERNLEWNRTGTGHTAHMYKGALCPLFFVSRRMGVPV